MKNAAAILALFLSGCASTLHTAPSQSYRPKGSDQSVMIRGKLVRDTGMRTTHKVAIGINSILAAEGNIGRGTGDIAGSWEGKPVQGLCNRSDSSGGSYSIHCRVIIDGEFAATLTF